MSTTVERRFPSPFGVATPPGAEGWESMYPPYLLFSEDNRAWEDEQFFFLDSLHRPEVEYPFDTIVHEAWNMSAGGFTSRILPVPAANGFCNRILNGRLYTTTIPAPPDVMEQRVPTFMRRAGFYYQNWTDLYEKWQGKLEDVIARLKAIEIPELPDLEDEAVVTEARGTSTGYALLGAYDAAIQNVFRVYQYHFELLILGYAAYMNLQQFCKQAFPGIHDQTIANLAAGADILLFRPDDEVKKLARAARDLGLEDRIRADKPPAQIVAELRADPAGAEWVAAFDAVQDPWFHYSTGTGLYHHERSWIDDLTVPWAAMKGYLDRLARGESLDRPTEEILRRREKLTTEYRALLTGDEDRAAFDENVALARVVAPFVEDHNFYIEHRHHTTFWNKMRTFGDRLVTAGSLDDRDDFFYLNRWEVGQALYDMVMVWAAPGMQSRSKLWKSTVARRKKILDVLRGWQAEPALGPAPPEVNEPFTIMLWGLTTERIQKWLSSGEDTGGKELQGVAASSGVVEGVARIVLSPDQIPSVEEGEIMVCPITAPSWGPVFGRIKATVSDMGGIMCHAAIVSREYGLPAVVGTGRGTKLVKTGDRIRVDGDNGVVTILS